jgi:heme/copper-type cytochrome/quinol oxidase subunit 2
MQAIHIIVIVIVCVVVAMIIAAALYFACRNRCQKRRTKSVPAANDSAYAIDIADDGPLTAIPRLNISTLELPVVIESSPIQF